MRWLAALLAVGCTPDRPNLGAGCQQDVDCFSDELCDAGRCVPVEGRVVVGEGEGEGEPRLGDDDGAGDEGAAGEGEGEGEVVVEGGGEGEGELDPGGEGEGEGEGEGIVDVCNGLDDDGDGIVDEFEDCLPFDPPLPLAREIQST